ncbi:energy-coupling factor ABC transporter permease [Shimia thalassica]|uniref:energy-coupling factor ABC transporter permease n=1 Tax=Shimia thalassica TaxID=1715693 RepID=UPI0026E4697D|nr:energy-coupling factor ABC transporter permease [Shimia thalassica]MDO6485766.1 energy-coupling factor ABC transporter permease [Shimia thalassica]
MHIEPGVVTGAKIALSYATAAAAATFLVKEIIKTTPARDVAAFAVRALLATVAVFIFFEVLPKHPVGVSEVHFILGSTLFLIFGAGPTAIGLAAGLLMQGLFFAPIDLPQYFMNVTTLLVPLFAVSALAKRIIAPKTAYVDLKYSQALALSTAYQGGVVLWVAFWAVYGQGFGAENMANIMAFGGAYMLVAVIEPLADLGVLAAAKALHRLEGSGLVSDRVYKGAA